MKQQHNIKFIICYLLTFVSIKLSDAYFITVDETKFHLVKSYLCRYGYMNENICKQHADDSLKFMQNNARDIYRGLIIFQTMFNITRTGKIDEDTIMKMAKPRCGNKDFDLQFSSSKFLSSRTNDYSILRRSLTKLTYSIRKYNPYLNRYSKSLSNEAVESIVDRAFNTWLKHLNGDVRVKKLNENEEQYDNSNITIYFAEGNHGDSMLFDGIDGELAHSCSLSNTQSPFRGHVHMDDSENWNKGTRLMSVLLHQIGHLFGLDHSSNPNSVMSPLFHFQDARLLDEDIKNMRVILGLDAKHRQMQAALTSSTSSTTKTQEFVSSTVPLVQTTQAESTTPAIVMSTTTAPPISSTINANIMRTETTNKIAELLNELEQKLNETMPFTTKLIVPPTTTSKVEEVMSTTSEEISPTKENIVQTTTLPLSMSTPVITTSKLPLTETKTFSNENSIESTSFNSVESSASSEATEDQLTSSESSQEEETTTQLVSSSSISSEASRTTTVPTTTTTIELITTTIQTTTMPITTSTTTTTTTTTTSTTTTITTTTTQPLTTPILSITTTLRSYVSTIEHRNLTDSAEESEFNELIKLIGTTQLMPDASEAVKGEEETNEINDYAENIDAKNSQEKTFYSIEDKDKSKEVDISDEVSDFSKERSHSPFSTTTHSASNPITDDDFINFLMENSNLTNHVKNETVEVITTTQTMSTNEDPYANNVFNGEAQLTTTSAEPIIEQIKDFTFSTSSFMATKNEEPASDANSYQSVTTTTEKKTEIEDPAELCNDSEIDAITRTEWGNAFIFKGNYIWHVRGLTKWRLFDYEGWPKRIMTLFPALPGHIDSAYLYDDHYHFTKNEYIWKYKISTAYPPKYVLAKGYPKLIKEEYPDIPFKTVDSVFSIATSIFFFKDYEFWQNDWNSNVTGKIPFRTNAAVSWRNPRLDSSLIEPLAYIVSNSSMYKFNYWSIPISQESLDIRYFLFDCVQANYKPHNSLFLGPSYKQAFLADDVYNREGIKVAREVPSYVARLVANENNNVLANDENTDKNKTNKSSAMGSLVREANIVMRSLNSISKSSGDSSNTKVQRNSGSNLINNLWNTFFLYLNICLFVFVV